MSARLLVEVYCNGPDANTACPDSAAWPGLYVAEVRERMDDDGWATGLPGGLDRCPLCNAQAKEKP